MNDPTTRALRLLSLLQTHRFWTGVELVDELGVSARTVRRDVDRLRELGYHVEATSGVAGGYRLDRGAALPPLVLDDDEAVAMVVGLRSSTWAAIEGIEATSLRALAKLEQVLPDQLRRRVNAINTNTSTIGWGDTDTTIDPNALALLAQGCRDREEVRFDYESRNGETTSRLVEPHQLVSTGRRWYLVAFDLRRNDWRTFRLDRLIGAQLAGRRFERRPPPAESYEAFVAESVRPARRAFQGVVEVALNTDALAEFIHYSGASIERVGANRSRVAFSVDSFEWLVGLVAMLAGKGDVTIVSPPELRKATALIARRLRDDSATSPRTQPRLDPSGQSTTG
jgi:predicted DNA-binding transcriptional regulator YafY